MYLIKNQTASSKHARAAKLLHVLGPLRVEVTIWLLVLRLKHTDDCLLRISTEVRPAASLDNPKQHQMSQQTEEQTTTTNAVYSARQLRQMAARTNSQIWGNALING